MKSITVYCGSAEGVHSEYLEGAFAMGQAVARAGMALIYGAGKTGLMGAVADGALAAGGEVIGVIPPGLNTPRLAHAGLTRLEVTPDIHARKARMSELGDALIALPGGFGTFDELFEALTWVQIGIHQKPVGLLNLRSYFDPLLKMIDHAAAEKFIYPEHRQLLCCENTPETLLTTLKTLRLPKDLARWVNRD